MKREAVVFYLKELRDLEIAKYKLNDKMKNEKYNYYTYNSNNGKAYLQEVPQFNSIVGLAKLIFEIAMFIIAAISLVMLVKIMWQSKGWGIFDEFGKLMKYTFVLCLSAGVGGAAFAHGWCGYFGEKKRYYRIILENKKEEERVRENQNKLANYKQQYDENMSVYKEDLKKVEQLLTDYYSLNIIAYPPTNCNCPRPSKMPPCSTFGAVRGHKFFMKFLRYARMGSMAAARASF